MRQWPFNLVMFFMASLYSNSSAVYQVRYNRSEALGNLPVLHSFCDPKTQSRRYFYRLLQRGLLPQLVDSDYRFVCSYRQLDHITIERGDYLAVRLDEVPDIFNSKDGLRNTSNLFYKPPVYAYQREYRLVFGYEDRMALGKMFSLKDEYKFNAYMVDLEENKEYFEFHF